MSDADNRRNSTLSVGLVSKYQKAAPIANPGSTASGSTTAGVNPIASHAVNPVLSPIVVPLPAPLITEVSGRIEFTVGSVLAGKYRLERALGVGGMGAVWVALNTMTDAEVALKVLHEEVENPEALARFRREAHLAAKLSHRGIVRVFDLVELKAGTLAMVMEILRGETLAERLDRERTLPPSEAVDITLSVASALAHAHSLGIVHRDLKPENVFLCKEPDGHLEPKILDFGISKLTGPAVSNLTMDGTLLGTPGYMSPEQARGDEVDGRSDLFVLGILLYEMISGDNPFTASTYNAVIAAILERDPPPLPQVSNEVWAVIERAFSKRRAQRYGSAADFAHALRLAAGLPMGNASFQEITGPASSVGRGGPASAPHGATPKASTSAVTMQEAIEGDDGAAPHSRPIDSGLSSTVLPRTSRALVVGGVGLALAAIVGVAALVRAHRQEETASPVGSASVVASSAGSTLPAPLGGTADPTAVSAATAPAASAASTVTAAATSTPIASAVPTGATTASQPTPSSAGNSEPPRRPTSAPANAGGSGTGNTAGHPAGNAAGNAESSVTFPLQNTPPPATSTAKPATQNAGPTAPANAPPTATATATGVHTFKTPDF